MHPPLPNRGVSDTSDDAAEAQYRVMRAMSPSRKVALVEDANRTARRLALAGIHLRCPDASDEERSRLLIELLLGEELAERAFGPKGPARGR